jgi:hypothetical protein
MSTYTAGITRVRGDARLAHSNKLVRPGNQHVSNGLESTRVKAQSKQDGYTISLLNAQAARTAYEQLVIYSRAVQFCTVPS